VAARSPALLRTAYLLTRDHGAHTTIDGVTLDELTERTIF
jgi:hypothetical protein